MTTALFGEDHNLLDETENKNPSLFENNHETASSVGLK